MTASDPTHVQRRVRRLRHRLIERRPEDTAFRVAVGELAAVAARLEAEAAGLEEARHVLRQEKRVIDERHDSDLAVFDAIPAACLVTDVSGIVRRANLAAADLFARQPLVGRPLVLRFAAADRARIHAQATAGGRGSPASPAVVGLARPAGADRVELRCAPAGPNRLLWVARDVSEQEATYARLREAARQAQAAVAELRRLDDVRNAFILAVSHDLQAPLAAIAGLAGLLFEQPDIDVPDRRRMLEQVRSTSERLLADMRGLLDLERLQRDDVGLEPRRVDVGSLIGAAAHHVDLGERELSVEASPLVAVVDPLIVEGIVHNLVVNVRRHTPPGTTAAIRFGREPDGLLLVVEDDGPGIAEELRPRVFELFSRDRRSPGGGLGVGLALVRRFAELHGGSARVEPRPGGGASFQVLLADLPLPDGDGAPVAAPAEPAEPAE